MIIAWPNGIPARDEVRMDYVHVTDVLPTVLDCLHLPAPDVVNGHPQKPLEGISFHDIMLDPNTASQRHEQFNCMLGTRGIGRRAGTHAQCTRPYRPAGDTSTRPVGTVPPDRGPQSD